MTRLGPVLAVLLAAAVAAVPSDVRGCGGAYRPGDRVDVADETALIVWDAATKTQHFIRRATFVGTAYDFGFLVPTPSRPQLEPADPALFDNLQALTAPKTETRYETGLNIGCGGQMFTFSAPKSAGNAPAGVVVLEQKRVGDLDAAVLAFADPKDPGGAAALLDWLNRNGYAVRPDLEEWLKPYAAGGWVMTAFKIAGQPPPGRPEPPNGATAKDAGPPARRDIGLQSTAVRMSFRVESGRPFFPYREPADQRDERAKAVPRLLRVYVASNERMAGKLGDGSAAWPGRTVWANAVGGPERDTLAKLGNLPGGAAALPGDWWLTEFEDRSTPRPGTDEVYFEPSPDPSPVARPPHVHVVTHTPWWLGAVVAAAPLVLLVVVVLAARRLWK